VPLVAHVFDSPSTIDQLGEATEKFKEELESIGQQANYLHVKAISTSVFERLEKEPDLFRGVRASVAHH
jgi:hypothetical protein